MIFGSNLFARLLILVVAATLPAVLVLVYLQQDLRGDRMAGIPDEALQQAELINVDMRSVIESARQLSAAMARFSTVRALHPRCDAHMVEVQGDLPSYAVVSVREQMYVHSAQSMGASTPRILLQHILPNVLPPVIVLFTTRVGAVILVESGLSFLGFGVPPPAPTWGGMLSGTGRTYMYLAPWLALAPGLCLTMVVYGINVLGDAMRDLLDPRMRGSR